MIAACAYSGAAGGAGAPTTGGLDAACRAYSSYELDVEDDWLRFGRGGAAPRQVAVGGGRLLLDGAPAETSLEDRDRLVLFEEILRGLLPEARALATRAVDLAFEEVDREARSLSGGTLGAPTRNRLQAQRDALHVRIAESRSSRDWQGGALDAYAQTVAAELLPLLAADVAARGIELARAGEFAAAARLQQRVQQLPQTLPPRIHARVETLRPEVEALCPRLRQLAELGEGLGVRAENGAPLRLLETGS